MWATVQNPSNFMFILVHSERLVPSTALRVIFNTSYYQENIMNKDQVKGSFEKVKGKVKEVAGKAVGNKDLEQEGKVQHAKGKVQTQYGDLKEDVKNAI